MAIAAGIDLVMIKRIEKSLENNHFLTRFFGEEEQELFSKTQGEQHKIERVAANFAAKEAFSKALGTGVRAFSLCEVQILRDKLGAPYFKLSGKALELCQEKRLDLAVSLSHTTEYATAVVVAQTIER